MKHITFYLDFVSPFAYLAFEQLPQVLQGLSYTVHYQPVLLGALLRHHGQLGPAEIAAKRTWTYRQVLWLAQQGATPLDLPAAHPFNPLPLLRLAMACDANGQPNRWVCESVLRHVWIGGADALDAQRLDALTRSLAPTRAPEHDSVKAQLRAAGEQAIAAGVFGVPAFVVDDQLFWGLDSLPMLRAYLLGDAWFSGPAWSQAQALPTALAARPD